MASPKKIAVFGHSHVRGFQDAYASLAASGTSPVDFVFCQFMRENRPHIVEIEGRWQYEPALAQDLQQVLDDVRPDAVVLQLQGEQSILAGLLPRHGTPDFYLPGETEFERARVSGVVAFDLVCELVAADYRLMDDFLAANRGRITSPALAVCPPPPTEDVGFILEFCDANTGDIARALKERGIPDSRWRQRMWRAGVTLQRSIYERHGVRYLEPPAVGIDAGGFLPREFYGDPFHAAPGYYRHVIDQLADVVH